MLLTEEDRGIVKDGVSHFEADKEELFTSKLASTLQGAEKRDTATKNKAVTTNVNSESHWISLRLPNAVYDKIMRALENPANNNISIRDYCQNCIERFAFRHSTRRYRNPVYKRTKSGGY